MSLIASSRDCVTTANGSNAPQRGRARSDLKPGLRMVVFENCVTIAYLIGDGRVDVLRFLYRGRLLRPELF
ncbi:hypothetical protein BZG35_12180 [Brevundimonas sp. LM2]|nr:hypothetical protein BZG35_12180 [Brevundimonas sp. LM2]